MSSSETIIDLSCIALHTLLKNQFWLALRGFQRVRGQNEISSHSWAILTFILEVKVKLEIKVMNFIEECYLVLEFQPKADNFTLYLGIYIYW